MTTAAETGTLTAVSALTDAQKQQFERDGFILMRGLISKDCIERISTEIDVLHERMAQATPNGVHVSWEQQKDGRPRKIRQLMHSDKVSPTINEIVRCKEVLDVVEALTGSEISLCASKLMMKAAQDGTVTPWHQDYAYFKTGSNQPVQLNCMLAIDPATRENGCIQFVPGTQQQGLQSHQREDLSSFSIFLPGYFQPRPGAVAVEMEPGDCVFFGPLVIHGSDGNRSAFDRRANTVVYTVTGDDMSRKAEVLRSRK